MRSTTATSSCARLAEANTHRLDVYRLWTAARRVRAVVTSGKGRKIPLRLCSCNGEALRERMCRGEQLRQTDRQRQDRRDSSRREGAAACKLPVSNRPNRLRGWTLELSSAERSMEGATRLDDTAVRSSDAGR